MSRINLLLSTAGPGSEDLLRWNLGAKPSRELLLKCKCASEQTIAEMTLMVNHIFAVDDRGEEHFLAHLGGQRMLLGSNTRGNALQLKDSVALSPGKYTSIKLYVGDGSSQTLSNRITEKLHETDHVTFELSEPLTVAAGDTMDFELSFRLNSFSFRSFWDSYGELNFAPWMRGRLGTMM